MKKILAPVLFMSVALSLQASYYPQSPNASSDGSDGWQESSSSAWHDGAPKHDNYPPHLHLQEAYYQPQRQNNNNYNPQYRSDVTSQTQAQNYRNNQDQFLSGNRDLNPNDTFSTEEDRNIAKRIRDSLHSELNQVTVKVHNGKVTLRGTVTSEDDINRIEQTINKIQGVRSFNNQLVPRDNRSSSLGTSSSFISENTPTFQQTNTKDSFQTDEDKLLGRKIREQLSRSKATVVPEALIIRINNGNVTLIGIVETEDDKSALEENVGNVQGVKTLTNQLNVRNPRGSFLNKPGSNISATTSNQTLKQTTSDGKDTFQTDDDRTLGTRIRDNLRSDGLAKRLENNIIIRINNGNVTLRGNVETAEDKARIEANVKKLPGVRSVDNQIILRDNRSSARNSARSQVAENNNLKSQTLTKDAHGDSFQTSEDRELVKKIREALKGGWFSKGYEDIAVVVNNGNVSLLGKVDSQSDINKIEERVKNVSGIRNLDLQISLKKANK